MSGARLRPCRAAATSSWPPPSPGCARPRDLESEPFERARVEALHRSRRVAARRGLCRGSAERFSVVTEDLGFPSYVITPRHLEPTRHALLRPRRWRSWPGSTRSRSARHPLASRIGARVVMPDYPLAPEHTWRDSHDALVEQAGRCADRAGGIVLAGDSSGGGLALALALSMRDRGLTPATHLVLHAPWVDLTTSTPETASSTPDDPWLFYLQAHGVRRVVGRLRRRPRPPRGVARARRPARPAAGHAALRLSRPPRTGLPAAGDARGRAPAGTSPPSRSRT